MPIVTMRELLECGVHFGHQTKRWNPKMKKYIFTARNDIHVIDLQKTLKLIEKAYQIIKEKAANGGKFLFVGTKKQAQEAIQLESLRSEMFYVNQRWLGGTLTNHSTIRKSINKLKKMEKMKEENVLTSLSKKEASQINKQILKLNHYLGGIKEMNRLPDLLIVVDTQKEQLAIQEAKKLNIPVVGVVDTNADPTDIKYPIPANDDAIRAIKLICSIMANAIIEGRQGITAEPAVVPQIEVVEEIIPAVEIPEDFSMEDSLLLAVPDEILESETVESEKIVKTRKKKVIEDLPEEKK